MDRFSRWLEIALIKGDKEDGGLKAENTLYKFKKRVVDYHRLPQVVLTDGSKSFMSVFDHYLKENQVEHRQGQAYKHDTNGMAERMIWTITEKLRHYVKAEGQDWDYYAHGVQTSLNSHMA
jgi:hypothetical protein